MARLHVAGADSNVRDLDGKTPLHVAAEQCRPELAELLLKHGADPNVRDRYGSTPLHRAVSESCRAVVELLLSHGADPGVKDYVDETPLDLAMRLCAPDVLGLLLPHAGEVKARRARCLAVLRILGFETPEKARRRCEPYIAGALTTDSPESTLQKRPTRVVAKSPLYC